MNLLNVKKWSALMAVLLLLTMSQGVNAQDQSQVKKEKIVANQLARLQGAFDQFFFVASDQEGYQITHACLYYVYEEWQHSYLDVLERTALDQMRINGLNKYAKFASSMARGVDGLDILYNNLFANVDLHVSQQRAQGTWPATAGALSLDKPKIQELNDNLVKCFDPGLITQLAASIENPDVVGLEAFSQREYSGVFRSSQAGGIQLDVTFDTQVSPSDIVGVVIEEASSKYVITQP